MDAPKQAPGRNGPPASKGQMDDLHSQIDTVLSQVTRLKTKCRGQGSHVCERFLEGIRFTGTSCSGPAGPTRPATRAGTGGETVSTETGTYNKQVAVGRSLRSPSWYLNSPAVWRPGGYHEDPKRFPLGERSCSYFIAPRGEV